jgi:hypothetical protein
VVLPAAAPRELFRRRSLRNRNGPRRHAGALTRRLDGLSAGGLSFDKQSDLAALSGGRPTALVARLHPLRGHCAPAVGSRAQLLCA